MNGLEIQTTQKWLIDYDFGIRAMRMVNAMMNGHLLPDTDDKVYGARYSLQQDGSFEMRSAEDDTDGRRAGDIKEQFIDVLYLEGPITRNGDACTYGSRQLRDMMMEAADTEGCIGHLLLINGPGGVSNSIPDFEQATDYARSKGQPILGRIDGICASAHCWIAAMCDEVYYNNPTDQIGSIGIYWAGITNKDGDTDPQTGGTWHIVYDPESYDKNRFVRDLADSNDDKLIVEELKADGEVFRNYIKSRRPNVKDEHLHGKMFDVKDMENIFVTGQATMQETLNRIIALAGKRSTSRTGANAAASVTVPADSTAESTDNILSTQLNNVTEMKEKFPALFAALAVEEMQMTEEGAFLNMGLLETLNAAIEAKEKESADAKALADSLTAEKAELEQKLETANSEHTAAIDTLKAEHEKALSDMESSHKEAIEEKDSQIAVLEQEKADLTADQTAKAEQIETLTTELNGAKASLETAQSNIAEKDQQIADLDAQVAELTNTPGDEPAAGAAPDNNGAGMEQTTVGVGRYVFDKDLSYEENCRRQEEWNKEHGVK